MHIQDIFAQHRTTFSFEFFPPKTDAASEELFRNIASLQTLQPSFVSVTYGAGGSTRERTHDLVVRIERETNLTAVSHLTCVCHDLPQMTAILDRYAELEMRVRARTEDPKVVLREHFCPSCAHALGVDVVTDDLETLPSPQAGIGAGAPA